MRRFTLHVHVLPRAQYFLRAAVMGAVAALLLLLTAHSDAATPPQDDGIFRTSAEAPGVDTSVPAEDFQESIVFTGLTNPTQVRFSPDGRVFVGEKSGLIKVFDSLSDTTPTTFADLRSNVHNFWDRGFLGMTLDPGFTTGRPYVYVLYAYDAPIGGTPPTWGDACPSPPGPTTNGCVISGRLSRLTANGNVQTGPEQVLINDWCQQFPSHSTGSLVFGSDGALYVSGGDGASFNFVDYGQVGNPCGDPPSPAGTNLTTPTAQGGALRSQDLRTSGDPATLDGSVLRLNPDTGAAAAGNPNIGNSDPNTRRIIAHGLRNPFRLTIRPGTNEVWVGDVGWNDWEEVNRVTNPTASVTNFGWPCYEGPNRQFSYQNAGLTMCTNLYNAGAGAVVSPHYGYTHNGQVVSGETCPVGSSSISGLAFYQGGSYPSSFNGALFFSDYSRKCIWVMMPGGNGLPNPNDIDSFVAGAAGPVDLQIGPGGDLFYTDFDTGTIRRIQYTAAPPPPLSGTFYVSDLTWTSMANGYGPAEEDTSNGGFAGGDGATITLSGTTYAKGLGVHAASDVQYSLGGTCTRFKASVGIDDEVGANGTVVFQVFAGATKVYDSGVMTGATATKLVDASVAGASTLRLVVTDAADGIASDHADWALARVECGGGGGDTTPPTVTGQTPAPGATGVSLAVTPTATFSEPVNPGTVTTSTFTLRQGANPPLAASVSYDAASRTAKLTPSAALAPSTSYTATVVGGASGVKDVAGNALVGNVTWSFTTGTTGTTSTYVSDLTWTSATSGYGPVELDRSNGGFAGGDGATITLSGTTYAKGLGVHAASDVQYSLGGTCTRFKASVGIDDEVGANGTVVFQVFAGATKVYDSGVMTGATATKLVDASVAGASTLRLVVTDAADGIASDHADWALARVECGGSSNTPPTPTILTPSSNLTWSVGDVISFSGSATDAQDGILPLSALSWTLAIEHCPSNCHEHIVQSWNGVASGSFTAPDHEYPTFLQLRLTATDSQGAPTTTSVNLQPVTVNLTFNSSPSGLQLSAGSTTSAAPFTKTVIRGSSNSISAPSPQTLSGTTYTFSSWSNGGAATHNVVANSAATHTATYVSGGGDTTPPTVTGQTPAPGATGVSLAVTPTATFSEPVNPGTVTTSTFTLRQGANPPLAASVSYDAASRTAKLTPSAALAPSTSYTATVVGGASGVKDVAGNALVGNVTWSFTTGTTGTTSTYVSDLTWTSATSGYGPVELDRSNGGFAGGDGATITLSGTTYAKGLGVHAASDVQYSLGGTCTRFKASVGIDDEVGANGTVVFQVFAGATKVYDSGVMTGATATKLVDASVAGASTLRLVVTDAADGIASDHADWALARVECGGGGGDTTPPTVTGQTPAPGATGVSLAVTPTATFSEPVNPGTVTTSTFTLRQGANPPLAASVSYDAASRTATLTPSAALAPSTSYTATVVGGASGVKDVAGNALVGNVTWSFTTGTTGTTSTYVSDLTWTSATSGYGPVELDRSNGGFAGGDGATITLSGTTYAKGLGVHAASDVQYSLGGTCTRFKASVGIDDEVGANGTVVFQVFAGATKVYDSGVMTGATATKLVDASVAGASTLRLVVTDAADGIASDHADWALARIEC